MDMDKVARVIAICRDYERERGEIEMVFNVLMDQLDKKYFGRYIAAIKAGWNDGNVEWIDVLGTEHKEKYTDKTRKGQEIKEVFQLAQKTEFLGNEIERMKKWLKDQGVNHI